MEEPLLARITAKHSQDIVARYTLDLDEEAMELLLDEQSPAAFLRSLLEHGQDLDAIVFLAHALPKREAVWWACLCVRDTIRDETAKTTLRALEAAEAWVKQPDETRRRLAETAAEADGSEGAAAFAALAAFLSGGSLAPADLDPIEPAEHLTGRMVAAAVQVAAQALGPSRAAEKHRAFLAIGINIARSPAAAGAG